MEKEGWKEYLTITFTQEDYERDMKNWGGEDGYPQCVFYTHRYRYSLRKRSKENTDLNPFESNLFDCQ